MKRSFVETFRGRAVKMIAGAAVVLLVMPLFSSSSVLAFREPLINYETVTDNILIEKEGYSSVLYDNSNGLPTSEANDIAQTADGFIWIGSYSGLIR